MVQECQDGQKIEDGSTDGAEAGDHSENGWDFYKLRNFDHLEKEVQTDGPNACHMRHAGIIFHLKLLILYNFHADFEIKVILNTKSVFKPLKGT